MLHWRAEAAALPSPSALHALQAFHPTTPVGEIAALMGRYRHFARNAEVFAQYERVTDVYLVVSGAVRFTRLLRDGRRQIGAFYLPGDLFGLESEERHSFSAETIVNSTIGVAKRSVLFEKVMCDQSLAFEIWNTTAAHLQRAQSHMSVLGRGTAQERLATFLLDLDSRANAHGSIELPMPRRDIADYLGLTIETISRVFHLLERNRLIAIPTSRRVRICDRPALERLSDG